MSFGFIKANLLQIGTGDESYILPQVDGTDNQVLSTNGSGVVSWVNNSGGGGSVGVINALNVSNGSGGWDDSNLIIVSKVIKTPVNITLEETISRNNLAINETSIILNDNSNSNTIESTSAGLSFQDYHGNIITTTATGLTFSDYHDNLIETTAAGIELIDLSNNTIETNAAGMTFSDVNNNAILTTAGGISLTDLNTNTLTMTNTGFTLTDLYSNQLTTTNGGTGGFNFTSPAGRFNVDLPSGEPIVMTSNSATVFYAQNGGCVFSDGTNTLEMLGASGASWTVAAGNPSDVISDTVNLNKITMASDGLTLQAGAVLSLVINANNGDSYALNFPATQGSAGQALLNDGTGNLYWG